MAWNFLHMELFGWTETVMFNDRVQNDWAAFPEAHKTHCKLHFGIMIEHRHTGTVYRDNAKAHAHPTWTYWALPFFGRWVRRHFRDERLPNVTFQGATNQGPVKVHLGVLGKIWTVDAKGTFKDNKTSDMFEGLMTIQWLFLEQFVHCTFWQALMLLGYVWEMSWRMKICWMLPYGRSVRTSSGATQLCSGWALSPSMKIGSRAVACLGLVILGHTKWLDGRYAILFGNPWRVFSRFWPQCWIYFDRNWVGTRICNPSLTQGYQQNSAYCS